MNHIANMTGMQIDNDMHKGILNKSIKISAWVQIGLGLIFGFGVLIWWLGEKDKV